MRLRWLGLELRLLGMRAGRHWSAPRPSFPELSRRWRTGLCFGQGQVLRLYLGRRGFGTLLMRQRLYIVTLGMWALGLLALAAWLGSGDPGWLVRWAALPLAVHSLLTWTLNGLGMLVGLTRPPRAERPAGVATPGPGYGGARC